MHSYYGRLIPVLAKAAQCCKAYPHIIYSPWRLDTSPPVQIRHLDARCGRILANYMNRANESYHLPCAKKPSTMFTDVFQSSIYHKRNTRQRFQRKDEVANRTAAVKLQLTQHQIHPLHWSRGQREFQLCFCAPACSWIADSTAHFCRLTTDHGCSFEHQLPRRYEFPDWSAVDDAAGVGIPGPVGVSPDDQT